MASLFKRFKPSSDKLASPFWWIKYRHPDGRTIRESTMFRIGKGPDTRKAEQFRAEKTLIESNCTVGAKAEKWNNWVPDYLSLHYLNPLTLSRARTYWRTLGMFLAERQIIFPRQLTRVHCADYMTWRTKHDAKRGKYKAAHNTARGELKFLGFLMREAVLRDYCPFNPCRELQVKRVRTSEKPELPPGIIRLIYEGIRKEPEPLRTFFFNSFTIARYHGARISETYLNPMKDVDLAGNSGIIRFWAKGGMVHSVGLHPALVPMFRKLRREKRTETYIKPRHAAFEWHRFFKRHGLREKLPGICFHCTRVSVASALARGGVSERKAKRYLNHASSVVHAAYVRLRPEDLTECSDAIG